MIAECNCFSSRFLALSCEFLPTLLLLFQHLFFTAATASRAVSFNQYRDTYLTTPPMSPLHYGHADKFDFGRFRCSSSIENAVTHSFFQGGKQKRLWKRHGNHGTSCYASTRLGGDWVMAESKQMAVDCNALEVLEAYLDGKNQKRWNGDKVMDIQITRILSKDVTAEKNNGIKRIYDADPRRWSRRGGGGWYRQRMVLKPLRILGKSTGVMEYTQLIRVDKIGKHDYSAYIRLLDEEDKEQKRAFYLPFPKVKWWQDVVQHPPLHRPLRPFDNLSVHVNLEKVGRDVFIYACGIMKVNRNVVPHLGIFDACGIAGAMAGKETLWLSKYFAKRKRESEKVINERKHEWQDIFWKRCGIMEQQIEN